MGTSPRMMSAGVIRDGVVVHGNDIGGSVGPGYYSPSTRDTSLLRPSYNVHCQQHTPVKAYIEDNSHIASGSFARKNSSGSINFSSPSSNRPRSGSAARHRRNNDSSSAAGFSPNPTAFPSPPYYGSPENR